PRKAGEEHTTRELGKQPRRGEADRRARRGARPPARDRRHRRAEVEREERGEREHGERGERRRQSAVAMHADEHPPRRSADPRGREREAERRGVARRGDADAPGEQRDRDQLQWPEVAGNERRGLQRTERSHRRELDRRASVPGNGRRGGRLRFGNGAQAPSDPSASSAARVTLNQRTEPPRASMTAKARPPIVNDSPRRGTRPSSCATRPPMVSNSSVGKKTSNASLTAATVASPATRWLPSASV